MTENATFDISIWDRLYLNEERGRLKGPSDIKEKISIVIYGSLMRASSICPKYIVKTFQSHPII